MYRRQKQVMDSFVRVRSFLDANPASGALGYASARDMLDEVVQLLRTYAGAQHSRRDLSRAAVRRQADPTKVLAARAPHRGPRTASPSHPVACISGTTRVRRARLPSRPRRPA